MAYPRRGAFRRGRVIIRNGKETKSFQGRRVYKRGAASVLQANPFNQKKQTKAIIRNQQMINSLMRTRQHERIATDFKYSLWASPPETGVWKANQIIIPNLWNPTMRQNTTQYQAKTTFVRNVCIQFETKLTGRNLAEYYNFFVVQARKVAADRDFTYLPPTVDVDYIVNPSSGNEGVTLNPEVFKVLAKKQFRLEANGYGRFQNEIPTGGGVPATWVVAGTPSGCSKEITVNIPINAKLSAPDGRAWSDLTNANIPYYQQIWVMVLAVRSDGTSNIATDSSLFIHFTCMNTQ